jgi:transcription elongation factor GreA
MKTNRRDNRRGGRFSIGPEPLSQWMVNRARIDIPRSLFTKTTYLMQNDFLTLAFRIGKAAGPRVRSSTDMSDERIPITREGYDRLKADLDRMANVEMVEIAKRIATAREMGDLSENAEYHAAREDQGHLQARIDQLKDKLSRAYFIEKSNLPRDVVVFGARVKVKDLDLEEEESFELVGPGDEDYNDNKILTSSPIGQGLLGKKIGEVAEIQAPMGTIRFEVIEISFPG